MSRRRSDAMMAWNPAVVHPRARVAGGASLDSCARFGRAAGPRTAWGRGAIAVAGCGTGLRAPPPQRVARAWRPQRPIELITDAFVERILVANHPSGLRAQGSSGATTRPGSKHDARHASSCSPQARSRPPACRQAAERWRERACRCGRSTGSLPAPLGSGESGGTVGGRAESRVPTGGGISPSGGGRRAQARSRLFADVRCTGEKKHHD